MASVTFQGNTVSTTGELPKVGEKAPDFALVKADLSEVSLSSLAGKNVVLNIFPSIDTGTCATSVRKFNEKAADLDNTIVICVSADLPFAAGRFCGAEGIENAITLSDFVDGSFGKDNMLEMTDGPLANLHSRCVISLNKKHEVIYTEQVSEIVDEPDYERALGAL